MDTKYWAKIGKGLAIAMAGAGCTYLLGVVNVIDVNILTPTLVALFSTILNVLKVWLQSLNDKKKGEQPT